MKSLSHSTKVAIRKTIAKLARMEKREAAAYEDPITTAMYAEEFVSQAFHDSRKRLLGRASKNPVICSVLAYSCNSEALHDLERFAIKKRLIKKHRAYTRQFGFNPFHQETEHEHDQA